MTSAADSPATECDLLVIGGGINGAGIARDAAGRGYRVILAERDDLVDQKSMLGEHGLVVLPEIGVRQ